MARKRIYFYRFQQFNNINKNVKRYLSNPVENTYFLETMLYLVFGYKKMQTKRIFFFHNPLQNKVNIYLAYTDIKCLKTKQILEFGCQGKVACSQAQQKILFLQRIMRNDIHVQNCNASELHILVCKIKLNETYFVLYLNPFLIHRRTKCLLIFCEVKAFKWFFIQIFK